MNKKIVIVTEEKAKSLIFQPEVFAKIINGLPAHLNNSEDVIKKNIRIKIDNLIGESSIELFLLNDKRQFHIGYLQVFEDDSTQYFAYKAEISMGAELPPI